jgi:hypothetical protein
VAELVVTGSEAAESVGSGGSVVADSEAGGSVEAGVGAADSGTVPGSFRPCGVKQKVSEGYSLLPSAIRSYSTWRRS